jgi:hypothetical protein
MPSGWTCDMSYYKLQPPPPTTTTTPAWNVMCHASHVPGFGFGRSCGTTTCGTQGMDGYRIHIPGGGGTIPADLGFVHDHDLLWGVGQSTLTGTIPASIGQWTALTYFDVFHNALTGTLPESIGQWTRLEMFIASRNQRTGTRYRYPSDDGPP